MPPNPVETLPNPKPATIRAVLFDMDDTVFDHTRTARTALAGIRRRHVGLQRRSLDDLARRYGELLDEVYPNVLAGKATHASARVERFRRLLAFTGQEATAELAGELSAEYRTFYQSARVAVPGALELLERLHGNVVTGIVSNNHRTEQLDKLRAIGLTDRFDFLLTSEEARVAKPDPRIFALALERANCRAEEAVMLGDSWSMDIVGARAAGVKAVWFNRFKLRPPEPADVPQLRSLRPTSTAARRLLR